MFAAMFKMANIMANNMPFRMIEQVYVHLFISVCDVGFWHMLSMLIQGVQ